MAFTRTKEDFDCEHCGTRVEGDGYTNHCPECLWSKHVDVMPGDRLETCSGAMRPLRIEGASPDYAIVHKCVQCGHEKSNKVQKRDNLDAVVRLANRSNNA